MSECRRAQARCGLVVPDDWLSDAALLLATTHKLMLLSLMGDVAAAKDREAKRASTKPKAGFEAKSEAKAETAPGQAEAAADRDDAGNVLPKEYFAASECNSLA